ncbi:ABC transporter ATP-binding protein [Jannaschia seohaensis]|uniref:Branched-chain amino acid transport system ATP-binding protein n=1 Tax=Jannaschia seohaensis TaxID=475081 RepID=A0A2Y9B4C2_9RHOB|nr:ABC transporter ATP-binding protein [Jannaschia seohaensis]PWJ13825.1 branched-chain amino acid transport system ATP-binding protein [Jannaschia seohaensis]SSA50338.1 branched-chain amino acid transport system ATP-binding protein [Jannaschia seohaensis]
MAAALEITGLTRRFGGLTALDGIDLTVEPGESLGLIGPNGSGKTSVFNLLTGHLAADAGSIRLSGREIAGLPSARIVRLGVARTFQNLRVLKRLTVYENLRAARHAAAPALESLWQSRAARRAERDAVMALLALFGLEDRAHDTSDSLTLMELRELEIARVMAADPALVLLDEPAAGMTAAETDRIGETIATHLLPGRSAIVIEHKIRFLTALCPRLAVLNAGRKIADGPSSAVLDDAAVRDSYFGSGSC